MNATIINISLDSVLYVTFEKVYKLVIYNIN